MDGSCGRATSHRLVRWLGHYSAESVSQSAGVGGDGGGVGVERKSRSPPSLPYPATPLHSHQTRTATTARQVLLQAATAAASAPLTPGQGVVLSTGVVGVPVFLDPLHELQVVLAATLCQTLHGNDLTRGCGVGVETGLSLCVCVGVCVWVCVCGIERE